MRAAGGHTSASREPARPDDKENAMEGEHDGTP